MSSSSSSLWYSVIGNGLAAPTTWKVLARISKPPGARLSSNILPVTMTEDSMAAAFAASSSASGRFPFFAVTWMMPLESRTTANTMAPLLRVR